MAAEYRTLEEVAADMKVSARWLRNVVRERNIPVLRRGRVIRFDQPAINALEEALRCPDMPPVSASLSDRIPARSRSSARSTGNEYDRALKAAAPSLRAKKPPFSKQSSYAPTGTANVVALDPSRRPR